MPRNQTHLLSPLEVERLRYKGREQYFSDGGGLYLAVRKNNLKEWLFRYTSPVSETRRKQVIGTFPDTTLKQARSEASEKRNLLTKGFDPIMEADKQRAQLSKDFADQQRQNSNTIENVFTIWKKEDLQNRKDKGNEIERAFIKDVFPLYGKTPIAQLTRSDIKDILSRPLSRGSKRMANILLTNLKQFFGYADDEELIIADPTRRLTKDRVGGREIPKKRYLKENEIKLLTAKLSESCLAPKYIHALWLLMCTGCRVNEIQCCRKKDIDIVKRTLRVPDIHAKNKAEHIIHLSDFALIHAEALLSMHNSKWLFPNFDGTGPVSKQTITKQFTDRQETKKIKGRTSLNQTLMLPGGRWTSHDLRRTAASHMQELGVMPHVIKKCLNQRPRDKMEETYQHAEMKMKQRKAFDILGAYLQELSSQHQEHK